MTREQQIKEAAEAYCVGNTEGEPYSEYEGAYFAAGARWADASREEMIAKAAKENLLFYPNALDCKHDHLEPDTCMTYMRCEECGTPAHLAALLSSPKASGGT